jgi:hypothetical protein
LLFNILLEYSHSEAIGDGDKKYCKGLKLATGHAITTYLAFLVLCDKLLLRENCNKEIAGKIWSCLFSCSDRLQAEHLRNAAELPSGHAVRKLFAEATVKDFVLARKRGEPFRFETELKEVEGLCC